MNFKIYTLGCKVNQYESEAVRERLLGEGFFEAREGEAAGLCIINTCTVTGEADRKCRQIIRRAIEQNPDARIIVAGCYAEVSAAEIAAIQGVDVVCGAKNRAEIIARALCLRDNGGVMTAPADAASTAYEPLFVAASPEGRTRAYVKIGDGCNAHCSYCIIPMARGAVRSRPQEDIISEVKTLLRSGFSEIVLTAIEISEYGVDLGYKAGQALAELLRAVDGAVESAAGANAPNVRIRLGSLDPSLLRAEFIEKIAPLSHIAPHFHLSLQSGCDRTLAAMRRRYNASMITEAVTNLRAAIPNVMFTADLIAGFPDERACDFEATRALPRQLKLLNVHAFAYSPRRGTPAAAMTGQIPYEEKKRRTNTLIADAKIMKNEILRSVVERGATLFPLFEHGGKSFVGHTPNFIEVELVSETDLGGQTLAVRPLAVKNGRIVGEIIK